MDETVRSLSDGKQFSRRLLVSTPRRDDLLTETRGDYFLSKYQHLDSQKIAESFTRHLGRKPLGAKGGDYKREATAQSSTQDLYQLPVSERLTKRYEQRRCSTPRSRRSSDGSERPSSPEAHSNDCFSETFASLRPDTPEELAKKNCEGTRGFSEVISLKTKLGDGCDVILNAEPRPDTGSQLQIF